MVAYNAVWRATPAEVRPDPVVPQTARGIRSHPSGCEVRNDLVYARAGETVRTLATPALRERRPQRGCAAHRLRAKEEVNRLQGRTIPQGLQRSRLT